MRLLEQELQGALPALAPQGIAPVALPIAVNADSLATWLAPALATFGAEHPVLMEVSVDDQDHTTEWLRSGAVLAALLGFAVNSLVGLLGFWFLEVASFLHVLMTAQYFLSGHMFPLSLLPDSVQQVVIWLPFAYETYFPTMILLQRLDTSEAVRVLLVQSGWVVVLLAAGRIAWWRGLRRYAAYGG